MISLLIKILLTLAVHLALFVCYPETGKYGRWYLWGSVTLWTVLYIVVWTNLKFTKLLTFPIASFLNIGMFLIMVFFIILTMPQRDGKSVFKKISSGQLPTMADIETGKVMYLNGFIVGKPKKKLNKTLEDVKNSIDKAKKAAARLRKADQ